MALSAKQRAFIDAYLHCWNASEAARQAGYSEKTAGVIGHENLKKPEIQEAIQRRVDERAMSANEALVRLAEHARSSMGDFLSVTESGPQIDLQPASLLGKLHLIRKLKTKTRIYTNKAKREDEEDVQVTEIDTEIELYNAQTALELIGKTHKLFTDRIEHDVRGHVEVSADDLVQARDEAEAFEQEMMGRT